MRLIVDLRSHLSNPDPKPEIVQVQRVPALGAEEAVNGKYVISTPGDIDFPVDAQSYVLDALGRVDGGDVSSIGFAHLLASMPQYRNVYYNPLLTAAHVSELSLDRSEVFVDRSVTPHVTYYPRCQTGREAGVPGAASGQMPTHTAILPANSGILPIRPGLLLTKEIDIGPFTLDAGGVPVGADEFAVYWKVYSFNVTHDIAADLGAHAGKNEPALRKIVEVPQEPTGFSVHLSTNDGAQWCRVGLLENVAFCDRSKRIRLAFRNNTSDKMFLACYAVCF